MYDKQFLIESLRSGGNLVVNKALIGYLGLIPAILLSSYLEKQFYFEKKNPDNDGWFYLSHSRLKEELKLKEYSITQSKKTLLELGLISVERRGIPSKEWIIIDFENLSNLLEQNYKTQVPKNSAVLAQTNSGGLNNKTIRRNKTIKRKRLNNIVAPSNEGETIRDKNKTYLPIAKKLANLITSKKRVKINGQKLNGWANSIRLMVTADGIKPARIHDALDWYADHFSDDFVPVIESGTTFRDKFIRLEAAIERGNNNRSQSSGFKGRKPLTYQKPKKV